MSDFSWVTDEMFSSKLEELIGEYFMTDWRDIPGVYDAVREFYNNEVLKKLEEERADASSHSEEDERR